MIRIALVDDDREYCKEYKAYIEKFAQENHEAVSVQIFYDGDGILENYHAQFDIILMDIDMKFVNGMDAAKKIRETDSEVIIIFMTNLAQYAMEGYQVDALDYVLKPISYYDLSQRLSKAIARLNRRKEKFLLIPVKSGAHRIELGHLMFVEVQNHDLIYHMADGEVRTRGTMRDAENQLIREGFFRCNNCYLINLSYVQSITGSDVKVGNEVIPVSRSRRKELMNAMNDFMSEVED